MKRLDRVLHIITGLNDGGAEAVLYRLCIHDESHHHTVVSLMDAGKYGPLLSEAGIAVHCLNMPRGRVRVGALRRLWQLLRQLQPDVVQTWMYHADLLGGVVARLAGIRSVVWGIRHTTLMPGKSPRSTIAVARLLARLSRLVPTRIVACAEESVAVHGKLGYDTTKMRVIPNGYDLAQFAPDRPAGRTLRAECGVPADIPLLGMVGRFDPQKDHANLLAALSVLRSRGVPFRCVLVGTDVDTNNAALMALIEKGELQDTVQLLGRRSDIPAVMNALDVHVLSSAFGEAFPNVLAEAMACGTPCVTTGVGDAAFIVGNTGWVVPPGDSVALASALEEALTVWRQPGEWSARQKAARQRIVDHFSIEKMIQAYHSVWAR